MSFRKWCAALLVLMLAAALVGCGDAETEEETDRGENGEAVAIVNGETIPRNEFDELLSMRMEMYEMQEMEQDEEEAAEMEEMLKQQTLDELITRKVLVQKAEAAGIVADEATVDQEYQLVKDQYEEEEFQHALEAQNLTPESFKEQIALQLVIVQFVEEKVDEKMGEDALEASEEELQALYEQHSMQMEDPPEFEEVKPQLEEMLRQEKMQEVTAEVVDDLVTASEIEILL